MGSKTSKTTQTQTVTLDPGTQQLNAYRLQQEQQLQPIREKAYGEINKLLSPGNQIQPGALTAGAQGDPTLQPYANLNFASPEQAAATGTMMNLTDMSALTGATNQYISQVVGPQILASLTASGMGRSGAAPEALARAGAQVALPLEQMRESNLGNLAQYVSGLANQRQGAAMTIGGTPTPFTSAPTTQNVSKTSTPFDWGGFMGNLVGSAVGGWAGGGFKGLGSIFGGGGGAPGYTFDTGASPPTFAQFPGGYTPPVFGSGWNTGLTNVFGGK